MQCPRCLRVNPPQSSACVVCGERLPSDPPAAATRDARGERRQLTVVFSDLIESTTLADRFDAEDFREIIRAYQQLTVSMTRRHGGTVAQYLGDGMVLYFGYPHALEDAAQRAVRAGLAMLEGIRDLNGRLEREYGVRIAVRLGVHTGYAVVAEMIGESGRDNSPVGDTMHIAARLCGLAAVDSILISDATHRLIQGFFDMVPVGAQQLKGIRQPLGTHRVLAPSAVKSRFEVAARRGLTPFVGRVRESQQLDQCWQIAATGRGQVVVIAGEAGIGKSRLIHEFQQRLGGAAGRVLLAACPAEGQDSAFHPILDFVGQILGFSTEPNATERRARLDHALATLDAAVGATSLVARLLGLPVEAAQTQPELSPEAERRRLIGALIGLLMTHVRAGAGVLVVEDLHWADSSTIEVLDELVRRVGTPPLLLVLSTRPDFRRGWPRPPDAELMLERLPPEDARVLVRSVIGATALSPTIIDDLVRATDGVPLFAEEFTRVVVESPLKDVLADADTPPVMADWFPSSLRDLLMTRLDNLGPTRDLAQVAAVLGRTFDVQLLAVVMDEPVATVTADLARLAEADLIFQETSERPGLYVFKHALLRDAAYDALLRRRRRDIHARVAATLEQRFPDTVATHPEVIAYHLTQAGRLDEAVTWWQRAARHAIASHAGEEAIRHLRRALEIAAQLPSGSVAVSREADLRVALCSALYMTRGTGAPEVGDELDRAREICERAQRHSDLHMILYMLAGFHNLRAEYAAGQRVARDALVLADLQGGWSGLFPPSMARAAHLGTLGASLWLTGDFSQCLEVSRAAMAAAGSNTSGFVVQFGSAHPAVVAHCNAASALWFLGFPDQAVATVRRGLELIPADDMTQSYSLCFAQAFVAQLRLYRREAALALAEADQLVTLAREHGSQYWLDTGRFIRAGARVLANDGSAALAELEVALTASQGSETRISSSMWLGVLAAAQMLVGRPAEALGWVRAALAFATERSEGAWYPELRRLEGTLLLALDPEAQVAAETSFREALRAARAQKSLVWELRAAGSLAALQHGTAAGRAAYEDLANVYARFTEGFETPDLMEARQRLAELAPA